MEEDGDESEVEEGDITMLNTEVSGPAYVLYFKSLKQSYKTAVKDFNDIVS